jgi:hypothetical protein
VALPTVRAFFFIDVANVNRRYCPVRIAAFRGENRGLPRSQRLVNDASLDIP